MAVFRSRSTMPVVKRCVNDVRDGRQEDVKVFYKEAWWEWDRVHKTWQVHF